MSLTIKEFKELHNFVDEIYDEADRLGLSWVMLAQKADLSITTVYRLGNYDTPYPRASTVFALAKAVGFKVHVSKGKRVFKLRIA